jgi:hypothetical protein
VEEEEEKKLTVEQWRTRNAVNCSQLHETLYVIHTCCGIIISIIISLYKIVITKLKFKNVVH